MGGALTGGIGAGAAGLDWVIANGIPVLGAAIGGATEQALEPGSTPEDALKAGAIGAGTEVGGAIVAGGFRRGAKIYAATKIAPRVAEKLAEYRLAATELVQQAKTAAKLAMESTRSAISDAFEVTRAANRATQFGAEDAARTTVRDASVNHLNAIRQARLDSTAAVRTAQRTAAANLAQREADAAKTLGEIRSVFESQLDNPPSASAAVSKVDRLIAGPVKDAVDQIGKTVAETAQHGPMIPLEEVKTELRAMESRRTPEFVQALQGRNAPAAPPALSAVPPTAGGSGAPTMSLQDFHALLAQMQGLPSDELIPNLTKVLNYIQEGPNEITFSDAHLLKKMLDEAVNWDHPAKKSIEQMTKGLRGTLRDLMSGFQPYNQATAAYDQAITLYRKGIGGQILKALDSNPDDVIRLLNPDNPIAAEKLRNLLIDLPASAGGDPATSRAAWSALQDGVVHKHVLEGSMEGLADRAHDLITRHRAFYNTVFHDAESRAAITNAQALGQAYNHALAQSEARIAAEKAAGSAAVTGAQDSASLAVHDVQDLGKLDMMSAQDRANAVTRAGKLETDARSAAARKSAKTNLTDVRDTGRANVQAAQDVADRAKGLQDLFDKSSLKGFTQQTPETVTLDIARVGRFGLAGFAGMRSAVRLLSDSATNADLLYWATYDSKNTARVVKLLTSRVWDRASADTLRTMIGVAMGPQANQPPAAGTTATIPAASRAGRP